MLVRLSMRHGFAIIADEVFLDFPWEEGGKFDTLDPRGLALTFTVSGLSKTSALPQMKLGWIVVRGPVGPDAAAAARLEVIADTYLSASTPTQTAAPVLLEQRKLMQPQILDRIRENLSFLDAKITGSAVSRLRAEGGWYATLRLPSSRTDDEWALHLLEGSGVQVHPGHLFGFAEDARLVVSLITPVDAFQAGIGHLVSACR